MASSSIATCGSKDPAVNKKQYLPFRGVKNDTSAFLALDTSLREIRYVQLEPGAYEDDIICKLGYTHLRPGTDRVPYEAVSYCWGEIKDTAEITIHCPTMKYDPAVQFNSLHVFLNDETIIQPFRVTKNLEALLRALRYEEKSRRLWVDAICINQHDAREKTHQVGTMGHIYASSMQVLVWLGERDLFSDFIFESHAVMSNILQSVLRNQGIPHLGSVAATLEYYEEMRTTWLEVFFQLPAICARNSVITTLSREIQARGNVTNPRTPCGPLEDMFILPLFASLNELLSRPWFRRIWVLQEVLLAPNDGQGVKNVTLCVGNLTLTWYGLLESRTAFVTWARIFCAGCDPEFHPLRGDSNLIVWFTTEWTSLIPLLSETVLYPKGIDSYLARTVDFLASDLRDKLFALLHLADNTKDVFRTQPLIYPDYEKPLEDVMADFVHWRLADDPHTGLMYLSWPDPTQRHRLPPGTPSWVPDIFATKPQDAPDNGFYRASGDSYAVIGSSQSRKVLSLQGFKFTHIREAITPELVFKADKTTLRVLQGKEESLEAIHYLTSHCSSFLLPTDSETLYRGVCDMFANTYLENTLTAYAQKNGFIMQSQYRRWTESELVSEAQTFIKGFWKCQNRSIFATTNDSVALCPKTARPGDVIAIIYGGNVPFILRPRGGDDSGEYEFIGSCYFYGRRWMKGEAVRWQRQKGVAEEMFNLV